MAKVDRKKLLKEPDEFQTISDRVIRWSRVNLQKVLWGATVVALAAAAVLGAKAWFDWQERKAAAELAPVMTAYIAAVEGSAGKAALTKLSAELQRVTAEYGSTPAGLQARLALGDLYLSTGEYAKAVETLHSLTQESGLAPELVPLAWHGLGQGLEGQKDYSKAGEAYAKAVSLAGPSLGAMYKLDRARVLAAAGDKKAAAQLYREVLGQAGDTPGGAPLAERARAALTALGEEPSAS
ncbi:MAG: tetratricopeptide repeat protein [Desulfarculaceae bacterium]|nr:tetratricopeptide repeat protein [Desulfarculaceae bacterium]